LLQRYPVSILGLVGISGYAGEQWRAAAQGHPALKAIFPYDACGSYEGPLTLLGQDVVEIDVLLEIGIAHGPAP
jgi:hypothetical protein